MDPVNNSQDLTSNRTTLSTLARSHPELAIGFSCITAAATCINIIVLIHILRRRLYRNFVSSHFIAHLVLTSLITCCYPIPVFIHDVYHGKSLFHESMLACRFHAFFLCMLWIVSYLMIASIAGIHLITFARIHYEQLFGLSPSIICVLSWLAAAALGLPCLTNSSIITYDHRYFHCLWINEQMSYKFLAYMILLGILIPICLTFYAYIRILAIFYHSPVVFEALGLYRSRYLLYTLLLNSIAQVPFFLFLFIDWAQGAGETHQPYLYPLMLLTAYSHGLTSGILYGPSLFLIKEEDIALTHRANRQMYQAPNVPTGFGIAGKL